MRKIDEAIFLLSTSCIYIYMFQEMFIQMEAVFEDYRSLSEYREHQLLNAFLLRQIKFRCSYTRANRLCH